MKLSNLFLVKLAGDIVRLPLWWAGCLHRRDPHLWVFGAWAGKLYNDNSRAVFEHVLRSHPDIKALWITRNPDVCAKMSAEGLPVAMADTREARRACFDAGAVFLSSNNEDVCQNWIGGAKQIWLWHGMPLKKWGYDFAPKGLKGIKLRIHRSMPQHRRNPAVVLSLAEFFNPMLRTAFRVPEGKILVSGYPRNDDLWHSDSRTDSTLAALDERFGSPVKILWMPTFRDSSAGVPFNPFALEGFDAGRLAAALEKQNAVLLYKGHNIDLASGGISTSISERVIKVTADMYDSLYSFVGRMDVLLTDYSSVYFDYLAKGGAVMLAPLDFEHYCSADRPLCFDYFETMAGPVARDWPSLLDLFETAGWAEPGQAADKFNLWHDDGSSERVIDYVKTLICG